MVSLELNLDEVCYMNILLTNTTVFSIKATTNSQEIILLPNQSVNTDCDQKSRIKLSFINTDRFDAKSIANNLMLHVSCTYSVETISENQNIHISNKIFELDRSTLLLPFAYSYLTLDNVNAILTSCIADNEKAIKKMYFAFALFGENGYDFLFNIFSIAFQMRRIKKLCDVEKIKKLIE